MLAGETLASSGDLGPAAFGQPDPGRAAGQHAAAEIVLAMAQQMQQRHASARLGQGIDAALELAQSRSTAGSAKGRICVRITPATPAPDRASNSC